MVVGVGVLGIVAARWLRRRGVPPEVLAERLAAHAIEDTVAVGLVGARDARIWYRAVGASELVLTLHLEGHERSARAYRFRSRAGPDDDGTDSVRIPDDLPGAASLEPLRRYRFALARDDGSLVGTGRFETAPDGPADTPDEVAFAIMSCHQPYCADGTLDPEASEMLALTEEVLDAQDVKRVLLLGDQMYADWPPPSSLFDEGYFGAVGPPGRTTILDCTASEVRELYRARYRRYLSAPHFLGMQRGRPCLPTVDDHELVDNFGSSPEHATPRWAALRQGALDACHDYQWLRVRGRGAPRPPSSHYGFDYGPIGVFMMDLRSERYHRDGVLQIVSDAQLDDLRRWLAARRDHEVILLGLSVPIVHVPDWLTAAGVELTGEAGDAADRWSHPDARSDRDRLLHVLREHVSRAPKQRLVLVGGDVHVGCAMELKWDNPRLAPALQLVSSAVSNLENPVVRQAATLLPRLAATPMPGGSGLGEAVMLQGTEDHHVNPWPGLNLGVIRIVRRPGSVRIRYLLYGHHHGRAKVVFDSGER